MLILLYYLMLYLPFECQALMFIKNKLLFLSRIDQLL